MDPQERVIQLARADAAARAGLPLERVQVVHVEERAWADTSLGCPAPDRRYLQVITPGYLVVVEAGGRQFEYHTDKGWNLVLCEGGRPTRLEPPPIG